MRERVSPFLRAVTENERHLLSHLYLYRLCKVSQLPDGDPLVARAERSWVAVLRLHGKLQLAGLGLGRDGARDTDRDGVSEYVLREAVTTSPDESAPRAALGRFLHGERRFEEAAVAYRRALELGAAGSTDDWRTRCRLAAALIADTGDRGRRGGEPEDSAPDGAAPETAADTSTDARRAERAARLAEAERELDAACATAPSSVAARRLLAWCLLVSDHADRSLAACDEVLQLDSSDSLARKTRGLARMRMGDVDAGLNEIAAAGWLE